MKKKNNSEYAILGVGRFGYALARALVEADKDVIVIDKDEEKIRKIRNMVDAAYVIQNITKETLEETGIMDCGTAVIGFGQIDASIMTALDLINLGIPRVIAKAKSYEHGAVLEKIGADAVYPEKDTAIRLAGILLSSKAIDMMELNDGYVVSEIKVPRKLDGKKVKDLGLNKYDIKMIALEKDPLTNMKFKEDDILNTNDAIVLIGSFGEVERFERNVIQK